VAELTRSLENNHVLIVRGNRSRRMRLLDKKCGSASVRESGDPEKLSRDGAKVDVGEHIWKSERPSRHETSSSSSCSADEKQPERECKGPWSKPGSQSGKLAWTGKRNGAPGGDDKRRQRKGRLVRIRASHAWGVRRRRGGNGKKG